MTRCLVLLAVSCLLLPVHAAENTSWGKIKQLSSEQPAAKATAKATVHKNPDWWAWMPTCSGWLSLSGEQTVVWRQSRDAHGNSHRVSHVIVKGVAVGNGTTYKFRQIVNFPINGGPGTNFSIIVDWRFIADDPNKSFMERVRAHTTINANGELVVSFRDETSTCN